MLATLVRGEQAELMRNRAWLLGEQEALTRSAPEAMSTSDIAALAILFTNAAAQLRNEIAFATSTKESSWN